MTQNLTAAQQTQLDNRDSTGQWKAKSHSEVEDGADVLGVSESGSVSASIEDRFQRTMAMEDLEVKRENRAKQAQLNTIIREDEARAESRREVYEMLKAHDMLDRLSETGVASVELTPDSDDDYYISEAEDTEGNDVSDSDELGNIIHGSSVDFEAISRQADLPTDIVGSVTFKPDEGLGEEFSRESLEAQRDEIIAHDRPKGPREAIRDALPDDPEIVDDVIARLDENQGLDSDLSNEHIAALDRDFPDDVVRRRSAREAVQGMEDRFYIDTDDVGAAEAHEYAADQVRKGRTDTDAIAVDSAMVHNFQHMGFSGAEVHDPDHYRKSPEVGWVDENLPADPHARSLIRAVHDESDADQDVMMYARMRIDEGYDRGPMELLGEHRDQAGA